MHWLKCSLLATTLCASYWQNSAALTELQNEITETTNLADVKENEINFSSTDSAVSESISREKLFQDIAANLTQNGLQKPVNDSAESKTVNNTNSSTGVQISVKTGQKREVENITFNDIKPFLLFPILPFLFPPKLEEDLSPKKDEFFSPKNETSKADDKPAGGKPFIFFDFAFFRRIPLNESSDSSNNTKIIKVEKLTSEHDTFKANSQKHRRRRNTRAKKGTPGFFDDSPLFPDSELEEFLPKPDLFFPDLPFHHKPDWKLNRRKRDQKKAEINDDIKSFFDAFDEAFVRTKKEFEQSDPILNFLRGGDQQFGEEKKDNVPLFSQASKIQEKPRVKWRIQRNIKKLGNRQDGLNKGQDGPMIIVDKVVKIGEFHLHGDGNDIDKSMKFKKDMNASNGKFLGDSKDRMTSAEVNEAFPKNIFELVKQEENTKKKMNHPEGQTYTKLLSKEIKIIPQMNISYLTVGNNATIEVMKSRNVNSTKRSFNYENLKKMIDNLKTKIKTELSKAAGPNAERQRRKSSSYYEKLNSKKASYDNLKKNITELLNQFLELANDLDDTKLMKNLEDSEHDGAGAFDWTEKETLQNPNVLGKEFRGKRQKKDADFKDEYLDLTKKERQVADLNFLFLTVTLPTVFIFAMALLVCFFSLQVKGKICTRLFRPRQVYFFDDETAAIFKNTTGTKTPPKVQAF